MGYVTNDYYQGSYLQWSEPKIPAEVFDRYGKLAGLEIDAITLGRVAALTSIPDQVRDCVCAIAEVLYSADAQAESYAAQGLAGPLASWSNDGQSGSVDLSQSIMTESGKRKEIRRLCRLYLGPLGLMYAGVRHYES